MTIPYGSYLSIKLLAFKGHDNAKEVDVHMSIEHIALLHGRPRPSKELIPNPEQIPSLLKVPS
ncbi:MAG: hypothetical protein IBJ00_06065 [Alphaproteobacteria bacterium]|nr:hypothetical protein [Alphaproteobacteria bacterium]